MCGECLEGYGLPVYSYSPSCVECTSYKYNWLKYIAVSFIPLTVFYFLVIILRISATSGYMLGYVTICQMVTLKAIVYLLISTTVKKHRIIIVLTISALSPWNLDFFRYFYHPFCMSPETTTLQVLLLDYLVAVYPMLLILLTYVLVKLHDNFRIAVYLCKPFYNFLHVFRKEWDTRNSLVGSFATFYLLSYVKILNVSANILTPTHFFDMNGCHGKNYFYFNSTVPYLSREHLPYAIFAIVMACTFNVFPLFLLLLYPYLSGSTNASIRQGADATLSTSLWMPYWDHTATNHENAGTLVLCIWH